MTGQRTNHTYDAIVVGSGISGGWAAKELCEQGLSTLLLERGRPVEHGKGYPTAFHNPWDFKHRLMVTQEDRMESPVQSAAFDEGNKHFFVSDREHPYIQEKPFSWIRGYQLGGRSLTWGRQCYRMSDLDFEANSREGIAVDWPIRYKDIAPWYDYVERYVGISGRNEGLSHFPDGIFLPEMEMNCMEKHFAELLLEQYPDRLVTPSRIANLTKGLHGRGPCQYRNLCSRGCPFTGYFSSNGVTIPAAMATGNLTIRTHSIVAEVLYNKELRKASGVRVMDAITGETIDYTGKIIFLNASTIATAAILLQSKSDAFPEGLGNSSGQVGLNLMDHFHGVGATGIFEGLQDKYYYGRSPGSFYIPRFRNLDQKTKREDYTRGYVYMGKGERMDWTDFMQANDGFGKDYKAALLKPGPWKIWLGGLGETLPYPSNRITLNTTEKDKWGLPLVNVDFDFYNNELTMRKDVLATAQEMLEKTGFKSIEVFDYNVKPGTAVHEMGTARMGHDPKDSVLNSWNQMHEVKNVFITDGSCMTSSGTQNPSLTYMALTARACKYAVSQLNEL